MDTNKKLIVKTLNVKVDKIEFNLVFHTRITLIQGDSGTGKTYLYTNIFQKALMENSSNIVFINYETYLNGMIKTTLNTLKNKLIIIDNADSILDESDKWQITCDFNNQYILFMKKFGCLKLSAYSYTKLVIDNNKRYLSYYVIENEKKMKQKHKKWMEMNSDSYLA